MSALVGRPDCHVITVPSLEEALDRIDLHPVDVIVACPAEGWGRCEAAHLEALSRRIALVVVEDGDFRLEDCGPSDHVALPCPIEHLAIAIERALWRTRRFRQSAKILRQPEITQQVSLEIEIGNERSQVPTIVGLLTEQAGRLGWLSDEDRIRARIALEEAILNAIIHGNLEVSSTLREREDDAFEQAIAERRGDPRYGRRRVILRMEGNGKRIRWVIRDEGPGFDVSKVPDPCSSDRIHLASGRGMLLMRSFMDRVTYNSWGNQVEMLKCRSDIAAWRALAVPAPASAPATEPEPEVVLV